MTTNGQLNNTRGYHIKPTNFTCHMISGFRLKGSCSSVLGKHIFCQRSQILVIVKKCYQWKIFW